jgi:shikimate kinase
VIVQFLGMKHTGKSTLGKLWATRHHLAFFDLDQMLEHTYALHHSPLSAREIYRHHGQDGFREWEFHAAIKAKELLANAGVLSWGGGTIDNPRALEVLQGLGILVHLQDDIKTLYTRILRTGLPAFLSPQDPWGDFQKHYDVRTKAMRDKATITVELSGASIEQAYERIAGAIKTIE